MCIVCPVATFHDVRQQHMHMATHESDTYLAPCLTCLSHFIYSRWTYLEALIYVHMFGHRLVVTYVPRVINVIDSIDQIWDIFYELFTIYLALILAYGVGNPNGLLARLFLFGRACHASI